jgi:hypothetical protein
MITPISSWRETVYIAKRSTVTTSSVGDQTQTYSTPVAYTLNVQPVPRDAAIELFGANVKKLYKCLALSTTLDINQFDAVYLDGATPTGETVNGYNANFIVRQADKQNVATIYYFESIKG